ncbi:RNA editing complex protein MP44 [Strigomonas culicis]|uniref:RNA editing complex protein MP44 n=1 Tax=Strigomonas culicis TaxID=28005 RepID=S9UZN1_9TRYP|nr:RNA editing complex protein MP44 [Strigomonas culicis]|eukprot:EPY34204.1 RNA editing complex protein MP44 [Strigomonas culicis]
MHHTTSRRHAASRRCLHFLRRHNVLMHSLLFYERHTRTWNTTKEFDRLAFYGESVLRSEVYSRALRLFPLMSTELYATFVQRALSEPALTRLFDTLALHDIVGSRPEQKRWWVCDKEEAHRGHDTPPTLLSPSAKCHMLFALVGEMSWFVSRTKASDRTHNNALFPPSDVLVLHVLCSHLLQCVPAELLYVDMEATVESVRAVWVNEPMSLPSQLTARPHTLGVHLLRKNPRPLSKAEHSPEDSHAVETSPLATTPRKAVVSRMSPKFNTKHIDALDNAFFGERKVKMEDPSFRMRTIV